jgi:hypothetical protein
MSAGSDEEESAIRADVERRQMDYDARDRVPGFYS